MSDLSFLIENQNQVQIDESLLQKFQQDHETSTKQQASNLNPNVTSRDLVLNRNKNLITAKKKIGSPRSFNLSSRNEKVAENEQLSKLLMRVQALEQNHRRMQKRIGVEFFQLKEQIQRRNMEQTEQFQEVKRLKGNVKETKRSIAQLLTLISKRK